ncbi:hypothetical protein ACZ90_00280 [Streptomyces albus subsp. albus]|nr:hypothetical protein ACZ90_00280 [Streptomyces albus subsp. albus]
MEYPHYKIQVVRGEEYATVYVRFEGATTLGDQTGLDALVDGFRDSLAALSGVTSTSLVEQAISDRTVS